MAEKNTEVPENRCGFELHPMDIDVDLDPTTGKIQTIDAFLANWDVRASAVCCWRTVWEGHEDTERCIWHTDMDKKPIDELLTNRTDTPERLDGAILRGIDAGDRISFDECGLIGATFDGASLRNAEFISANLWFAKFTDADIQEAVFQNVNLWKARFSGANLQEAAFYDADLQAATFPNAILREATFSNVNLRRATFSNALLIGATFPNSSLQRANFPNTDLQHAGFTGANLRRATFPNADLHAANFSGVNVRGTTFSDANLQHAKFPDANAVAANFHHANLQDAVLIRTDCREATFTSALLYETVFSDTRINSKTTFFDPDATFYDSTTARPGCVYEENRLITDQLSEDVQPLEAARWVYRRLETLHEENALTESARQFHISKEEAERDLYQERGEYWTWGVKTLMWHLTKHGESVKHVLCWWVRVILLGGLLFSGLGGVKNSNGTHYVITSLAELGTSAGIGEFFWNLYFSATTFSTIMDGGLAPVGPWTRIVVALESLTGALLVAFLVFVLGRRVAR